MFTAGLGEVWIGPKLTIGGDTYDWGKGVIVVAPMDAILVLRLV